MLFLLLFKFLSHFVSAFLESNQIVCDYSIIWFIIMLKFEFLLYFNIARLNLGICWSWPLNYRRVTWHQGYLCNESCKSDEFAFWSWHFTGFQYLQATVSKHETFLVFHVINLVSGLILFSFPTFRPFCWQQ